MKALNFVLLFCVILLFAGCKKYVVEVEPNFEGEWHSQPFNGLETYFIIDGNQGVYGEWCDLVPLGSNCSSYYKGVAKINRKESKFTIGKTFEGIGRIFFRIDVPPHINTNGDWECTLTNRVYIRN